MVTEAVEIGVYLPEQMTPGTLYYLQIPDEKVPESEYDEWQREQAALIDKGFVAVLACPKCGEPSYFTRRELQGAEVMICGSNRCSATYLYKDGEIIPKKPM